MSTTEPTLTATDEVDDDPAPDPIPKIAARQIGPMNLLAISGGRLRADGDVLVLPVSHGYRVEVELDEGADLWIVRRVFVRGGKRFVKGERDRVFAEDLSETAYRASCYQSHEF